MYIMCIIHIIQYYSIGKNMNKQNCAVHAEQHNVDIQSYLDG